MTSAETTELLRLLRGRLPSSDEIEAIRLRRLRSLVRHVFDNVPYYRRLFSEAELRPDDIRSLEDLRRVPVSTRDQLRAAGTDGVARGVDRTSGVVARTSGSTGEPWSIFRTRGENRLRRALDFRSMRWAGVRSSDVVATLSPLRPATRPLAKLGLYRTEHVSPLLGIDEQIERLRRIRPTVLWIYPSALRALLRHAGSLAAVVRPRMLITASEPFDDLLRRRILVEGPLEMRNFYGAVECGRIAWECAAREGLHVNADCLVLELQDDEVEGTGRPVVVTNLAARAMPILRYRLGDRCELVDRPCSCGLPLPLMRPPAGRDWDVVEFPSGRLVPPFSITAYLNRLGELRQYRVIQKSIDRLVIQLSCESAPAPAAIDALRAQLTQHFGEPIRLDFERVEHIDESLGKFARTCPRSPKRAPRDAAQVISDCPRRPNAKRRMMRPSVNAPTVPSPSRSRSARIGRYVSVDRGAVTASAGRGDCSRSQRRVREVM